MEKKETYCLTVVNQKGGVSKTTTVSCLGYNLAQRGFRVLLVDLDSQASLSQLCHIFPEDFDVTDDQVYGIQDVFEYAIECEENRSEYDWKAIQASIAHPVYRRIVRDRKSLSKIEFEEVPFGFDIIPSDTGLANYEQLLAQRKNGGFILWKIYQTIKEYGDYDFIITDCPPALTTLAYSGICAGTDGIIVPINLEVLALRGTKNIISAVASIQHFMKNSGIVHYGIMGLLETKYSRRHTVESTFEEIVDEFFPIKAFETTIPARTSCDRAHAKGWLFSQEDRAVGKIFDELIDEIIERIRKEHESGEPEIIESIGEEAEKILSVNREVSNE